jgi:YhcN/YlaJ family sporulation lipoprotein
MMKKRRLLFSILAIMIVGLLVVSCTVQRTPGEPDTQRDNRQTRFLPRNSPAPLNNDMRPNVTPGQRNQGQNLIGNNNLRPNNTTNQMGNNVQDRAEKLADVAAEQKEVESASCLITGDTAMIGLQFDDQYKGKLTDDIKEQVDKRVRKADTRIKRVVVTADPDLVSRIEEIFDETGKGKPLSGFADEINEIINRINPK